MRLSLACFIKDVIVASVICANALCGHRGGVFEMCGGAIAEQRVCTHGNQVQLKHLPRLQIHVPGSHLVSGSFCSSIVCAEAVWKPLWTQMKLEMSGGRPKYFWGNAETRHVSEAGWFTWLDVLVLLCMFCLRSCLHFLSLFGPDPQMNRGTLDLLLGSSRRWDIHIPDLLPLLCSALRDCQQPKVWLSGVQISWILAASKHWSSKLANFRRRRLACILLRVQRRHCQSKMLRIFTNRVARTSLMYQPGWFGSRYNHARARATHQPTQTALTHQSGRKPHTLGSKPRTQWANEILEKINM